VRRVCALAEEGLWELEEMVEDLVLKRQRVEVLVRLGKTKSIYICIIYIYIYIYIELGVLVSKAPGATSSFWRH
jgi:hypothetical protein